jgi:hypothetical protein
MARRRFLTQPAAWPLADFLPGAAFASTRAAPLKIMLKSAWGSDDPTKAAFPFSHGNAPGRGRPRSPDLSPRRGRWADAPVRG